MGVSSAHAEKIDKLDGDIYAVMERSWNGK
jgi:hypothetical protein